MSKGIVTIATGSERYYKMAQTLLYSLRVTNPAIKVAVVTDEENPYISEFDDAVILSSAKKSYLDKIDLLINCPYDKNIFIDADSIVYGSIDGLFDEFEDGTDFSCFGAQLPLDSIEGGYFVADGVGKWKSHLNYVTNLHGGLYYIRKGSFCEKMWKICMEIEKSYADYRFAIFKKPADEPIIALACSIMNCTLIERLHEICFLPVVDYKTIKYNERIKRVQYVEAKREYDASILHFSNRNTERALYRSERDRIEELYKGKKSLKVCGRFRYYRYLWDDCFGTVSRAKCTIYEYSPMVLKRIWRKMKD